MRVLCVYNGCYASLQINPYKTTLTKCHQSKLHAQRVSPIRSGHPYGIPTVQASVCRITTETIRAVQAPRRGALL